MNVKQLEDKFAQALKQQIETAEKEYTALRQLILYANLTRLSDAQVAGKSLFLGVSLRVFPEEIRIWILRLK